MGNMIFQALKNAKPPKARQVTKRRPRKAFGRPMGSYLTKKLATTPLCNGGFGADDIVEEVAIVRKNGVTRVVDGATYRYGLDKTLHSPSLTGASSASSTSQISDISSASECTSSSISAASLSNLFATEKDHGEFAPRINELTEHVKQAAEQKRINTQRMVAVVNEVKKLEVELDRAGQNLNQIQQRYNEREASIAEMRVRLKKVHEQMLIAREADRRRNS